MNETENIYLLGDVHGRFDHVIDVVKRDRPEAIVFLGDLQANRPLDEELAEILDLTQVRFIHGNHDTDSIAGLRNVMDSSLGHLNLDGRVETLGGFRIAGLGGIFRGKVWMPPAKPLFGSYREFTDESDEIRHAREMEVLMHAPSPALTGGDARILPDSPKGRRSRGLGLRALECRHRSTIFPEIYNRLVAQKADILVTHEAPSCHPFGFFEIDALARAMGVSALFHGHHHDRRDYRARFSSLGFRAYGVGLRGITAIDGNVIRPGEMDHQPPSRR